MITMRKRLLKLKYRLIFLWHSIKSRDDDSDDPPVYIYEDDE
jgi:hypothetical protein